MAYENYPKKLTIGVTDRCNLNCWICQRDYYESIIGCKGRDLPMENLMKLEKPLRHAETVSLTGFGETFLIPHLEEMLEYIFSLNSGKYLIDVITNGTLLSTKRGRLLSGHLQSMVISLNASTDETYKKYVGANLQKTLAGIREFMNELDDEQRGRIMITYVVHRENMHELCECVDIAKELGVNRVIFNQYQVNKEENVASSIYFYQDEYNEALKGAQARGEQIGVAVGGSKFGQRTGQVLARNPQECDSPFYEITINIDGRVVPCCYAGHYIGNVYEQDFDEVWFGEEYEKLRHNRGLRACGQCQTIVSFDNYRAHVAPDLMRRKPDLITALFKEREEHCSSKKSVNIPQQQGFDMELYEMTRAEFGEDYGSLLTRWLETGDVEDGRRVDACYEAKYWAGARTPVERTEIELSGPIAGTGWGIAESNAHGQKWRWVGPSGASSIFWAKKAKRNCRVETLIHTAKGDSLWDIRVEVNGVPVSDQKVEREKDLFFHRCSIPKDVVRDCEGRMRLTYKIGKADETEGVSHRQEVALSRVVIKESILPI